MQKSKRRVIVIGAGPAGLTAAYELLDKSKDFEVIVLEKSNMVGGVSRTVNYKGNRMDMGGHRFFSKVPEVNEWWEKMLPSEKNGEPNPKKVDRVMLRRKRLSRIFFEQKFFDYPISLKVATIKSMGVLTTGAVGCSYLKSVVRKRPERSLEDFYINRFGEKLYGMFFENYTEKLWGRHPREISPEWGAQRVKGLSIAAILRDIFGKAFGGRRRDVETSLIEEFSYPKFGPGQLWEITADEIKKMGGKIIMKARVVGVKRNKKNIVTGVVYEKDGKRSILRGDYVVSSMPIKDLVAAMNDVPKQYAKIAAGLPYRDFMTVGVLLSRLALKNVSDNWIYIQDKSVKIGRLQIYNNWSPYLVKDAKNKVWVGLEYFCNEGDELWNMTDKEFAKMAIREMIKIKIIENETDVLDFHVERVKKAYPAYFDTYEQIDELRGYLDKISNLFLVGRNGQHRYNNLDHSMCTAFMAIRNIMSGETDKSNIWGINTDDEYCEG